LVGGLTVAASGADDGVVAAVCAADDERVAATIAGDHARLAAVYSDDLRSVHPNGKIDHKAEPAAGRLKRASVYERFDYLAREFRLVALGVMSCPVGWSSIRRMPRVRTKTT
jgi:hypothetical protein